MNYYGKLILGALLKFIVIIVAFLFNNIYAILFLFVVAMAILVIICLLINIDLHIFHKSEDSTDDISKDADMVHKYYNDYTWNEEKMKIVNKVLWNSEMDYCIGLITELSKEDFIEEASRTHAALTGEGLDIEICTIVEVPDNCIWRLELSA